jgi:hypothetical protein
MAKHFFKSLPVFSGSEIKIDRENSIIRGVQIAKFGRNKNKSFFDEKFIEDLVKKGNEQKQGVKSRFGHPNMCATSFGTFIGRYKNFRQGEIGAGGPTAVFADLHIDPITKQTEVEGKGIKMYDYIFQMAENNPDMFGNSIHIDSDIDRRVIDEEMQDVHTLTSFIASDLVDDPAATDGLFSNGTDLGVLVTSFLDENPGIFSSIQANPSIIDDFFDRYRHYLSNYKKSNMNIFKKIADKFSSKFDVEKTTATGDVVTVVTEDSSPKVGDAVNNADGQAIADGDLLLADGETYVIKDGKIQEIKPATGTPEDAERAETMSRVTALGKKFETFQNQSEKTFGFLADQLVAMNKKFDALARNIESKKFDTPDAEETGLKTKGLYEKVTEKLTANKK